MKDNYDLTELRNKKAFICDMDGVIYHGNRIIPNVKEFLEWIEKNGGVEAMEERNTARANALYNALEQCNHFRPLAASKDRSIMNVTFTLDTPEMTAEFLAMAQRRGMISLKGYRTVGGCRASLYNGMPDEGVAALIDCICAFEIGKRT